MLSESYYVFGLNEVRDEVREMTENYEVHRGRELITFSDYCVYESLVQKHVNYLRLPAVETLKTIRGNVILTCIHTLPSKNIHPLKIFLF